MWNTNREYTIGRGEVAESRIELPLFAAAIVSLGALVFALQLGLQNSQITLALAVSLLAFGITLARIEFGIYILVVAMMLSPEIAAGAVGAHNERVVKFRYDDILILVIFLGIVTKASFDRRPRLMLPSPVNAGIFAYYAVCIISTVLALRRGVEAWDAPVAAFVMLKMFEFYLIFFMVGIAVTTRREIRNQLFMFFVVSTIVSLYGVYTIGALDRVSAPFEYGGTEPNTFGGYLLIVICVAAALGYGAPTTKLRCLFFGIAFLALMPFMQTLSRASYGALAIALVVLGLLSRRWSLVALVALAFIFAPYIMPPEVIERVQNTFHEDGQTVVVAGKETDLRVDKSTYERIYVWEKVRFNLTVWPWFGGGVSWETVLDSQYARVILETGLVGFAAFLFLLFRILRTTAQSGRWSSDWLLRSLGLGMTAVAVGLMVHSLGTISFLIVRISEPFWFLLALTAVGRSISIAERRSAAQQARAPVEPPESRIAAPEPLNA